MPAPLIGLTTSREQAKNSVPTHATTEAYVQAVLRAGGLPVLIPLGFPEDRLVDLKPYLQGLLLIGGPDIDPEWYGGPTHERVYGVSRDRDIQEFQLLRSAVQDGLPFLGICRGFQLVNVALGGKLFSDLADQYPQAIKHDYYPGINRDHPAHTVEVEAHTRLAEIVGVPTFSVNSLHHQGVREVAPGLCVTAHAPDGLIEGLELPDHPFGLAVQWHPEWLPGQAPADALFSAFIRAAAKHKP